MAEAIRAKASPAQGERKPMDYDTFLSCAHRDTQVTTAIQRGPHRTGPRFG
jgi:hypothetical protein